MKKLIVTFTKNKQRGSELCGHTTEGKIIFIHYKHTGGVKAGTTWECSIFKELDGCVIVIPVRKSEPKKPEKISFRQKVNMFLLSLNIRIK